MSDDKETEVIVKDNSKNSIVLTLGAVAIVAICAVTTLMYVGGNNTPTNEPTVSPVPATPCDPMGRFRVPGRHLYVFNESGIILSSKAASEIVEYNGRFDWTDRNGYVHTFYKGNNEVCITDSDYFPNELRYSRIIGQPSGTTPKIIGSEKPQ